MARLQGAELVRLLADPPSVAVVGASTDLTSPSGRPLTYLLKYGYRGRITAVNPRHREIAGLPCVPDVRELPHGAAEAAIVNLPAALVPEVIAHLADRGTRAAVVIGSGFEAAGSLPRRLLLDVLAATDLRLIGPNCVGAMSPRSGAHLNFSSVLLSQEPVAGPVALVTQSGALGNSLLLSLLRRGAGIAHWFSTGDELGTGAMELVAGLLPREEVGSIGLFLEGITDLRWLDAVREGIAATRKPVYVLRVARTDLGRLAAGGHTGRVVGSTDVATSVLAEAGLVEVPNLEALVDVLVCQSVLSPLRGGRLGVVSVSGASAVVAADEARRRPRLELVKLSRSQAEAVAAVDPRIEVSNPLDVPFLGETPIFASAVSAMAAGGGCDAVVVVESSLAHDRPELARLLAEGRTAEVAIVLTYLCPDDPIEPGLVRTLAEAGVAVVPTPERAVAALDGLLRPHANERQATADHVRPAVPILGLEAVAAALGFLPWARWLVVDSAAAARAAADELGYPVVIKAAGRALAHRSEAGSVRVGVTESELDRAYAEVAEACREAGDAVMVQEQAAPDLEILISGLRDPEFGPVVLVRPGGVLTELIPDQAVIWSGWPPETRRRRLRTSRVGALLGGYRGARAYDAEALAELIDRVMLVVGQGPLAFVEFNPVIVHRRGLHVVDAIGRRAGGEADADIA